jgi:hypothetical protein
MLEKIINFISKKKWRFTLVEEDSRIAISISGNNGTFQCIADAREDEERFIFLSICSANVPNDKRVLMSELLTRINYGSFLGNFEMDYEDGQIRYKTSICCKNSELTINIIEHIVMADIVMMDTSLIRIMKLIYGDILYLMKN